MLAPGFGVPRSSRNGPRRRPAGTPPQRVPAAARSPPAPAHGAADCPPALPLPYRRNRTSVPAAFLTARAEIASRAQRFAAAAVISAWS